MMRSTLYAAEISKELRSSRYERRRKRYQGTRCEFETKIMVKEQAPELLREELNASKWKPELIAISGVTDPYQPIERKLEITRRCLEVLADFRNPTALITKNHLITRDLDHLRELAKFNAVSAMIS